jgi:hypothetical protein
MRIEHAYRACVYDVRKGMRSSKPKSQNTPELLEFHPYHHTHGATFRIAYHLTAIHEKQPSYLLVLSTLQVGTSLLFAWDMSGKVGVWVIDFGKTLTASKPIDHRSTWVLGKRSSHVEHKQRWRSCNAPFFPRESRRRIPCGD